MHYNHFISYLMVKKLVFRVCFYHLVRFNYSTIETQPTQSVPVVSEFPWVFIDDLPESL